MQTLYTAHATSKAGRAGHVETDDGAIKYDLSKPGSSKPGSTNPEQLFAAGYSACFGSAVDASAKKLGLSLSEPEVTCSVSLNSADTGYFLSVELDVKTPDLSEKDAQKLLETAHQLCPYSKATRGNIDVTLKSNGAELDLAPAA